MTKRKPFYTMGTFGIIYISVCFRLYHFNSLNYDEKYTWRRMNKIRYIKTGFKRTTTADILYFAACLCSIPAFSLHIWANILWPTDSFKPIWLIAHEISPSRLCRIVCLSRKYIEHSISNRKFYCFSCLIAMVHQNSATVELRQEILGGPIRNHLWILGRPIRNRLCILGGPIWKPIRNRI